MAHHLTKEDLILKLTPYGFKSVASINRLIREQGLPAKYSTPRKVFFDEGEIDTWLARRNDTLAKANATHAKVLRAQREKRRKETLEASAKGGLTLEASAKGGLTAVNKAEA
jgi:hypothetical protein